jgi:hypothetical protein
MANKTLSDFPVLTNLDAASVTHVQKELVDYQVTLPVLTEYVTENAEYATLGNKIDGADEKTDPADADMVGLMDSAAAGNALKKFSWANFKAKLKTYFDALYPSANGWVTSGLTMTYASADSPTFTATVPGDVTGVLSAGMKIKLTQTTVKYFIITAAPSYSSGSGLTTLTFYGGTDYTLVNAAISNVYYSVMKAPHGFPLDPAKWTVEFIDTTQREHASPVAGTWYNEGSLTITIPIGSWYVEMIGTVGGNKASGTSDIAFTLSTASNTKGDKRFSVSAYGYNFFVTPFYKRDKLVLTSKTVYYLNMKTSTASVAAITLYSQMDNTIVRAVCAYL